VRIRLVLIVAAAIAGGTLTFLVAKGNGGKSSATPTPRESIQGPQVTIGDLTYNVTDVRLLKRNRPVDAPYLVNKDPSPKGLYYLGVFVKIYNNNPDKEQVSAPGYLLEPSRAPGLVVMQQASESPYNLDQGGVVPAGGELPIPGSPSAAGPIKGGLLLYWIKPSMTKAQPFRLVVHTGNETAAIILPPVPKLTGTGGH
jgi:hypothetical protein